MAKTYDKKLAAYFSAEQFEIIEIVAEAEGLSLAALGRVAVAQFIQSKGYELPGRTE